jgi:hypothetical protein
MIADQNGSDKYLAQTPPEFNCVPFPRSVKQTTNDSVERSQRFFKNSDTDLRTKY